MTRIHCRLDPTDAERLRKLSEGTPMPGHERARIALRQYLDREERRLKVAKLEEVER